MDRARQAVWSACVMDSCLKYVLATLRIAALSHPTVDSAYPVELIQLREIQVVLLTCTNWTASTTASINSLLTLFVAGFFHCGLCRSIPLASRRGMVSGSGKIYFLILTGPELRRVIVVVYSMAPQSRLHSALTIDCQVVISTQNKIRDSEALTPIDLLSF
jgi:hypothetical protein